jgi:hypothetical protein
VDESRARPGLRGQGIANLRRLQWPGATTFRSRHRRERNLEPEDPFDDFASPFEADNPFERVAGRPHRERLVVALHVPGLTDLTPDEAFVVGQITEASEDWGLRAFAVGDDAPRWRGVPVMQFLRRGVGPWSEAGRIQWDADKYFESGLAMLESTVEFLRSQLSEHTMAAAHDVRAAYDAGAQFVVSSDRAILKARSVRGLHEVNVLTPLEAGVLMGAWSRATGRNGLFSHWASGDFMYYWALARALTPAGWPAFGAFIHGRRVFPSGDRLEALAQSILTRIDYLVEALDDLYLLWQREVTNPVIEDITNLLDGILLRGWAVQDNAAVLISTWFGAGLDDPARISLHERAWRKAVRDSGPGAAAVIDAVQPTALRLRASQTLRHHAVHRETLSAMRVRRENGDEEASIFLPAPVSSDLRTGLQSAGEKPQDWGLDDEIAPHLVQHSVDHGNGYVEEFEAEGFGGAFLDPMAFAARFIATVAQLANDLFGSLQPAEDPRLPEPLRSRALRSEREPWATPEVGWQLVLASPLSGLVPWASPDAVASTGPAGRDLLE